MKKKRFFFHYNKPATQRAGSPKMSVHVAGQCHIVDGVCPRVPTESHARKTAPRMVMRGWCKEWFIDDSTDIGRVMILE